MSELRLARIDPITIGRGKPSWEDQRRHAYARPRPNTPKKRLIEALAPAFNAEDCDIEFTVDAAGEVVAVVVIERATATVVARCAMAEVARFFGEGAAGGLVVDREG